MIAHNINDRVSHPQLVQAAAPNVPLLGDGVGWNTVGGDETAWYLLTIHYACRNLKAVWRTHCCLYVKDGAPLTSRCKGSSTLSRNQTQINVLVNSEHQKVIISAMDAIFDWIG